MDKDTLGIIKRLQDRRNELDMSYQDLADKTGLSKSTLQRYETGSIKNLSIDKVGVLAKALNVSPAYLMGWVEKQAAEKPVTIAAHLDGEELTDEETAELNDYIEFLISRRKK